MVPLALPFDGVTPLFLHVVFDSFPLWYAAMERKVLVEPFALAREVPLLVASSPVAVTL